MIYFIQNSEGFIKIGSTNNIQQRIKTLQTGNSANLRLLYILDISKEKSKSFENMIHGICALYKVQGEWFKPEVLNHLFAIEWYKDNLIPASKLKNYIFKN